MISRLKGGKKGEKEEFDNLLKEAEAELAQSNSKRGGAAAEVPVAVAASTPLAEGLKLSIFLIVQLFALFFIS